MRLEFVCTHCPNGRGWFADVTGDGGTLAALRDPCDRCGSLGVPSGLAETAAGYQRAFHTDGCEGWILGTLKASSTRDDRPTLRASLVPCGVCNVGLAAVHDAGLHRPGWDRHPEAVLVYLRALAQTGAEMPSLDQLPRVWSDAVKKLEKEMAA